MPMAQFYIGGEKWGHGSAYADAALRALQLRQQQEQLNIQRQSDSERLAFERERLRADLLDKAKEREQQKQMELLKLNMGREDRGEERSFQAEQQKRGFSHAEKMAFSANLNSLQLENMRQLAQKELQGAQLTAEEKRFKAQIESNEKLAEIHDQLTKEENQKNRDQQKELHGESIAVDRERMGIDRDRLGLEQQRIGLEGQRMENEADYQGQNLAIHKDEVANRKKDYDRELYSRVIGNYGQNLKNMTAAYGGDDKAARRAKADLDAKIAELESRIGLPSQSNQVGPTTTVKDRTQNRLAGLSGGQKTAAKEELGLYRKFYDEARGGFWNKKRDTGYANALWGGSLDNGDNLGTLAHDRARTAAEKALVIELGKRGYKGSKLVEKLEELRTEFTKTPDSIFAGQQEGVDYY